MAEATSETYRTLIYERDAKDGFVTITLNRPDKLNAIDRELATELDTAVRRACADPELGAILLKGAGRAFCVGYDLVSEDWAQDAQWWRESIELCCRQLMTIWTARLPIVAQVQDYALGGGLELMLCCDIAVAAEEARFGEPEVRHASAPPTLMLPWTVPIRHARRLMYTGDMIDGREAARIHLVNEAVPAPELDAVALRWVRKLARMPKPGVAHAKSVLNYAQLLMGLSNGWVHNADRTAELHASEAGRHWLRLLSEKSLKEFLELREAPFRDLDR